MTGFIAFLALIRTELANLNSYDHEYFRENRRGTLTAGTLYGSGRLYLLFQPDTRLLMSSDS